MTAPVSTAGTGAEGAACAHCDRTFPDTNSLWQHTKAKHGAKAAKAVRPPRDREPSLGEDLAEAISDARAGQSVEGYLLDMFRDQFPRGTKRLALASSASARPGVGESEEGGAP